jgi:proteasome lid subunit RPN8/RPN11
MKYLTKNTDKEVQAFIIGSGLKVEDLIVFKQNVSSGEAENEPADVAKFITWCIKNGKEDLLPKIIGHFHSHNTMGCFWSQDDLDGMKLMGNTMRHVLSVVASKQDNIFNIKCRLDYFKPIHMYEDELPYEVETPPIDTFVGKTIINIIPGKQPILVLNDGARIGINGIDIHDDSIEEFCKKEIKDKCKDEVYVYPNYYRGNTIYDKKKDAFEEEFEDTANLGLLYIEDGIMIVKKLCDDSLKKRCKKHFNSEKKTTIVTTPIENTDIRRDSEDCGSLQEHQCEYRGVYPYD